MQSETPKPSMSEIYAEFDDSDNLEGNDEDIGALGSILSWDDDDDEAVEISVAATSSALEERLPASVSYSTLKESNYLRDMDTNDTAASVQMTFNTAPQGQSHQTHVQQQPSVPQYQQPQRTQQQTVAPAAASLPPTGQPQLMFYQMPPFQTGTTPEQQQAVTLAPGMTLAALPRAPQQQQPEQTFNLADPNAFLRQMQAAQLMQQQRPLAPQPAPIMPTLPQAQQTQQMLVNPSATIPQEKKSLTKEGTRGTNVVSCSDTDGDSTVAKLANKAEKKKARKTSAADSLSDDHELDTSHMTPAEKAKANRDRNREHARNTRLRKKAYLEKLKMTVDELCRERDTLVSERAGAANLLVEMHNTRTEVLMSFFALRSAYEKRRELWSSILDESCFACVMPVTPYRSFPASEVQASKCQRTILGIDGMMADTASLHVLLNSLIDRTRYPNASIAFRYTLVTEDAVVAGNQMMARWVMSTLNATQCGARMEVSKQGMLCCKFNSAHKIIGLELMFDVMAFMLQIKQAAGTDSFAVVPNTVQTCQRSFDTPMVMTLAERPYTIVQVNKLWETMTGFRAEDVVGKASCQILQGQETDRSSVDSLMNAVRFKRPASCVLLNYTRAGKRFRNYLNVYPLSTDSKVTHYVALTCHLEEEVDGAPQAQQQQQVTTTTTTSQHQPVTNSSQQQQPMVMAPASMASKPIQVVTSGVPLYMPQPILSSQPPMAAEANNNNTNKRSLEGAVSGDGQKVARRT